MARIGIDARLLSLPRTGIGRYTVEMVRAIKSQHQELYLYSPNLPQDRSWADTHTKLRSGHQNHGIGRLLWSQSLLPYWAAKDKIDVLWGTTHSLPFLLPAHIARVVTIHDLVWKYAPETMKFSGRVSERLLMPKAIQQADIIIADSFSTANDLQSQFPHVEGRVRVIHLGASTLPIPAPRESLTALGINKPYFLFVGTLEPRKNLRRLIEAFALLPQTLRHQYQLVIAGGHGWGGLDLNNMIKQLNVVEDICLTGEVTDAQLSTLYTHARFLAMPSLYEGFGLPLLESMSQGVPVLTSNISSMPEIVGDAGVLVDPLNIHSISDSLGKLMTDEVLHAQKTAHTKKIASNFSWNKAATNLLEICHEAITIRQKQRNKTTP